jgi:hypothetical protein
MHQRKQLDLTLTLLMMLMVMMLLLIVEVNKATHWIVRTSYDEIHRKKYVQ